jgi:phage terminase large subunit-like protein
VLKRIVVAVDPSGGGDEIGIIAAGIGHDDCGYVLIDATCKGILGALAWARCATDLYHDLAADLIVAESNFGGDLVRANIKVADPGVPVRMVHASRGKAARAEPIASLYGDDNTPTRVYHVGVFPELESEMTTWTPDKAWSPNRMDALVWALSELMLKPRSGDHPQSAAGRRRYFN